MKIYSILKEIKIRKSHNKSKTYQIFKWTFFRVKPTTEETSIKKTPCNIGFPIIGEKKYSNLSSAKNSKLMLHSFEIKFKINNLKYNFKADYPKHFIELLLKIK